MLTLTEILSPARLHACEGKRPLYAADRPPTAADYARINDARDVFWLLGKMGVRRELIVLGACACARYALPAWKARYPSDARPRRCIEVTEAWCRGEATLEEVCEARHAAYAAAYAYAYAAAADAAAYAYAAAAATHALAETYAYAAASTRALREMADLVRQVVPWPVVRMRANEIGLMEVPR